MSNVAIIFPTYNREAKANNLVKQIRSQSTAHQYDIYSFVDGSDYDVKDTICERTHHHGKKKYWMLYNHIIQKVAGKYDYYIYLCDDCTIEDNFIDKSVFYFQKSNAIVLNLLTDHRTKGINWTRFNPIVKGDYIHTQWVDMAMIFSDKYINTLGSCPPISEIRWRNKPLKSSGVGEWISKSLHSKGCKIYHIKNTLIHHGVHDSVMNKNARDKHPLKNIPIIAGVATFKGRERCIVDTYYSIINQVDELHIYANDDIVISDVIKNDSKVNIYRHPEGDLGDVGKFYFNQSRSAYYLSIDDDLIYPHDYVKTTLQALERYDRPVTWHGRNLNKKANTYYRGGHEKYRCLKDVHLDVEVEFGGTGVMAWKKEMVTFDLSDFRDVNMADVFVGCKLINLDLKPICIAHKAGWIKHSRNLNITKTIASMPNREKNQIKYIRELCPQLYS